MTCFSLLRKQLYFRFQKKTFLHTRTQTQATVVLLIKPSLTAQGIVSSRPFGKEHMEAL